MKKLFVLLLLTGASLITATPQRRRAGRIDRTVATMYEIGEERPFRYLFDDENPEESFLVTALKQLGKKQLPKTNNRRQSSFAPQRSKHGIPLSNIGQQLMKLGLDGNLTGITKRR